MTAIGAVTRQAARMAANAAKSLVPEPEAQVVDTATLSDPSQEKDWTVLVYMEGRDRLAHSTLLGLNKMESVGSSEHVNVVAQATVVPTWQERVFPHMGSVNTRRYYIQADSDPETVTSPVVGDLGEKVRLNQDSLADFLSWGMEKFPAKRYLVIVKKHGVGFARMGDQVPLSAKELQGALATARARTGKSADVLAWDSCSMGQMEVAHQVRGEAKVMTGSPEDVYAVDFPYAEVLKGLTPTATAEDVGRTIVAAHQKAVPYGIHTAVDLTKTEAFTSAMGGLVDALVDEKIPRDQVYTAMMATSTMDPHESLRLQFNFRDLGSFLENLETVVASSPKAAAALAEARQAFTATTIAHAIHPRKAHVLDSTGPSAYLPWQEPRESLRATFETLDYAVDTHWSRLEDYLFGQEAAPVNTDHGPSTQGLGLGQKAAKVALMGYKKYVSPNLGTGCPYTPSCSQYTREAIETHGLWEGGKMGFMRFISCSGHDAGGHDPVPGSLHVHDHEHGRDPIATVQPPSAEPKSELRRRVETGFFRAVRMAGRMAGGLAGLAAGAPAGLAFGAFFAWKAGTGTIDEHNKGLMGKYREKAVRSLIDLEKPLAMPAFRLRQKLQQWTGSARVATAVAGPVGAAVGALLGAAGGAGIGWRWGALFGGLLAENGSKDLLGELPPHPATEAILQKDYR